MIDKKHIGKEFPPHSVVVDPGHLRFFAKAICETDPLYVDEEAASIVGHPGFPLPPTFLFCLEMERRDPLAWLSEIGANLAHVLHAEQSFTYHHPAFAGDRLTFHTHISGIYDNKGGAFDFVMRKTKVTNQHGEHVADLVGSVLQRNA